MNINCPNCNTIYEFPFEIEFNYFNCISCDASFRYHQKEFQKLENNQDSQISPYIPIGSKANFYNDDYIVVNCRLKYWSKYKHWSEYELQNNKKEKIYLTFDEGNWSLAKPIAFEINATRKSILFEGNEYRIFEKGFVEKVNSFGFFPNKNENEICEYKDYICPPLGLSIDIYKDSQYVYQSEYVSDKEIGKKFGIKKLPTSNFFGNLRPFPIHIKNTILVFIFFIISTLLIHIIKTNQNSEKAILNQTLDLQALRDKEFETPTFKIEGPIAPLTISVTTDVNNNWVATDFELQNLTTKETAYFSKDVEYYQGVEGGESWSEGSKTEEFNICGVSSGSYKIKFKPNIDGIDDISNTYSINIIWGENDNWNFLIVVFTFMALVIILYFLKYNFERQRWLESDFFSDHYSEK